MKKITYRQLEKLAARRGVVVFETRTHASNFYENGNLRLAYVPAGDKIRPTNYLSSWDIAYSHSGVKKITKFDHAVERAFLWLKSRSKREIYLIWVQEQNRLYDRKKINAEKQKIKRVWAAQTLKIKTAKIRAQREYDKKLAVPVGEVIPLKNKKNCFELKLPITIYFNLSDIFKYKNAILCIYPDQAKRYSIASVPGNPIGENGNFTHADGNPDFSTLNSTIRWINYAKNHENALLRIISPANSTDRKTVEPFLSK
jgi:hypothetical protein